MMGMTCKNLWKIQMAGCINFLSVQRFPNNFSTHSLLVIIIHYYINSIPNVVHICKCIVLLLLKTLCFYIISDLDELNPHLPRQSLWAIKFAWYSKNNAYGIISQKAIDENNKIEWSPAFFIAYYFR